MGTQLDPVVQKALGEKICHVGGETFGTARHGLMMVGMTLKSRGMHPSRIVIRLILNEYVVHEQVWHEQYALPDGRLLITDDTPTGFIQGDYFPLAELGKALDRFNKRVALHLETHDIKVAA
jgi:hypothetical protein